MKDLLLTVPGEWGPLPPIEPHRKHQSWSRDRRHGSLGRNGQCMVSPEQVWDWIIQIILVGSGIQGLCLAVCCLTLGCFGEGRILVWCMLQIKAVVWGKGSGLVGLYMKHVLTGNLLTTSRNQLPWEGLSLLPLQVPKNP